LIPNFASFASWRDKIPTRKRIISRKGAKAPRNNKSSHQEENEMSKEKWLLSAGHHHLFHIVSPIVARARGYFEQEGVGECDFFCSGSDAETIKGMREGRYHIEWTPPFLLCGAKAQGAISSLSAVGSTAPLTHLSRPREGNSHTRDCEG
jgi:hypothetical protein